MVSKLRKSSAKILAFVISTTFFAGVVVLTSRILHALVYIAGIPYLRTLVFAVGQIAMLVYVWQIIAHFMAR